MSEKTEKNLAAILADDSKAAARHAAFAQKADHEADPRAARLFRALSDSKSVQARRCLLLLRGRIGSTRENLESALAGERIAYEQSYPILIQDAEAEGMKTAEMIFTQSREVAPVQAALLEKALQPEKEAGPVDYYVCQVCGYVSENRAPEKCPICGAIPGKFKPMV